MGMYNSYSQKDLDISLYDAVEKSINSYKDIDSCLKYYEVDKNLVGMMIHENYPNHISSNTNDTQKKKLNCIKNVIDNFRLGDVIDNYIYNDQAWDLFDLCGTVKIAGPSFEINPLKKKVIKKIQI